MIPLGVLASAHVPAAGSGALIEYVGKVIDTSNQSSYTFTDVPTGTPHAGSQIIVCACGAVGGQTDTGTVTIDGVTATLDVANYGSYVNSTIARGDAASTTADITVSFSRMQNRALLFVYRTTTAVTPTGSARTGSTATSVTTSTFSTASDGMMVAVGAVSSATDAWSFATVTAVDSAVVESQSTHATGLIATSGSPMSAGFSGDAFTQRSIYAVAYEPA